METEILQALEAHRACIRSNWENLLRIERISSPLANPDTLVHLLDTTLNEVFHTLKAWSPRRLHTRLEEPACPCGRNPLLAYFSAGHQALREGLVLAQTLTPNLPAPRRDESLACLEQVFSHIAQREIRSFCSICQYRDPRHKTGTPGKDAAPSTLPEHRQASPHPAAQ